MKQPPHITRPETIGKRLELTRLALGFASQKDFYAPTGLVGSAYSMWEAGDRVPRIEHAILLCREYDLSLDWIYRGLISKLSYETAMRIKQYIEKRNSESGEDLNFTFSDVIS